MLIDVSFTPGGALFIYNVNDVGHYETSPPITENSIEKNKCIHVNGKLKMDSCI
jgi:hypothetical protein